MPADSSERAARNAFPRGLFQPASGFRFGSDALLLAALAAGLPGTRAVDLGTGCGAAGLGYLLATADPAATVLGLDREAAMVAAAGQNAAALGLAERFTAHVADVRHIREADRLAPESCDLVLCNPPYRDPGSGRRPAGAARDAARFEVDGSLADFAAAAAYLLANKGLFVCIPLAERLTHVAAALAAHRLEIKRLLYVAAIAFLGASLYVADPPTLPAKEAQSPREMTLASAEAQSMVARLAEASMIMRSTPIPQTLDYSGPRPEALFGRP